MSQASSRCEARSSVFGEQGCAVPRARFFQRVHRFTQLVETRVRIQPGVRPEKAQLRARAGVCRLQSQLTEGAGDRRDRLIFHERRRCGTHQRTDPFRFGEKSGGRGCFRATNHGEGLFAIGRGDCARVAHDLGDPPARAVVINFSLRTIKRSSSSACKTLLAAGDRPVAEEEPRSPPDPLVHERERERTAFA